MRPREREYEPDMMVCVALKEDDREEGCMSMGTEGVGAAPRTGIAAAPAGTGAPGTAGGTRRGTQRLGQETQGSRVITQARPSMAGWPWGELDVSKVQHLGRSHMRNYAYAWQTRGPAMSTQYSAVPMQLPTVSPRQHT